MTSRKFRTEPGVSELEPVKMCGLMTRKLVGFRYLVWHCPAVIMMKTGGRLNFLYEDSKKLVNNDRQHWCWTIQRCLIYCFTICGNSLTSNQYAASSDADSFRLHTQWPTMNRKIPFPSNGRTKIEKWYAPIPAPRDYWKHHTEWSLSTRAWFHL